jgi:hypothetical protein
MEQQDREFGTVARDGIRRTQRTWLTCRDAWAAFGRARYPAVPDAAWKAWATTARLARLKELLPAP